MAQKIDWEKTLKAIMKAIGKKPKGVAEIAAKAGCSPRVVRRALSGHLADKVNAFRAADVRGNPYLITLK